MSEETVKRRLLRAKRRATDKLIKVGYKIIQSDNNFFCIIATREREIRMIRVVIDKITEQDIEIIKDWQHPGTCSKEIWCKNLGSQNFEIKEIL